MKVLNFLILVILAGCIGGVDVNVDDSKFSAGISEISSVDVQNNEMTLTGNNFLGTSNVKIVGGSVDHDFIINSATKDTLVAYASSALTLEVDTAYSLIITNGFGQATFPITFDLTDDSVTTAKIQDDAVTGAKISDTGAADGDVLKFDSFSGTWVPAADVGAGAGGGTVTTVTLANGLVAGVINVAGTVNVDTGTEAGTFTSVAVDKIPFINAANELTLTSNAKVKLDGASGNMSLYNDGTNFSIYDEDATADRLTVDATSGDVGVPGNLVVGTAATVAGQTVCLGNGVGCPASGGGTVTSITAGTGLLAAPGSPITAAGTLNVDVGTTNGQIPQVGAGNVLPTSVIPVVPVAQGGTGSTTALNARAALGVAIGANVQAYHGNLDDISVLATTDSSFIVGDGANFVLEDATTARTSLGLGTAAVLDVGTGANQIVQLDGGGALPAIDGSALTGLPLGYWNQVATDLNYTAGNVGVGTAAPLAQLDISGQAFIRSSAGGALPIGAGSGLKLEYVTGSDRGVIQAFDYAGGTAENLDIQSEGGDLRLLSNGTGQLAIGHSAPTELIHALSDTSANFVLARHTTDANPAELQLRKSRGNAGAPATVAINDQSMRIEGQIYTGAAYEDSAAIVFVTDGAVGAGDAPGKISFQTSNDGANITTEKMVITNDGRVGIGEPAPDATSRLEVNGDIHATRICSNTGANCRDLSLPQPTDGHSLDSDDASVTNALYVDSSGDVGIGTIAPASADLHLFRTAVDAIFKVESDTTDAITMLKANDARVSMLLLADASDDDVSSVQYNHNTETMSFETNDVPERMVIDGTGRVGINLGGAPTAAQLHIDAGADDIGIVLESTDQYSTMSFADSTTGVVAPNIGADGDSLILGNSLGEIATFEPGKLTVGAVAPSYAFDLTTGTTVDAINITGTGVNTFVTFGDGGTGSRPKVGSAGSDLVLRDGLSEVIRLQNSNVGIGTTTPASKLVVQGSGATAKVAIQNLGPGAPVTDVLDLFTATNSTGEGPGLAFYAQDLSFDPVQYARINSEIQNGTAGNEAGHLVFQTANAGALNPGMILNHQGWLGVGVTSPVSINQVLTVLGDVRVGTSGTNGCVERFDGGILTGSCSSDERFKKNIKPLDNVLDQLTKLVPSTYNWRSDEFPERHWGDQKEMGLIAQQVRQYFPELVSEDESGYLRVDYTKIPFILLQGLKEEVALRTQQARKFEKENLILKEKIKSQASQIQDLSKRLERLEKALLK